MLPADTIEPMVLHYTPEGIPVYAPRFSAFDATQSITGGWNPDAVNTWGALGSRIAARFDSAWVAWKKLADALEWELDGPARNPFLD